MSKKKDRRSFLKGMAAAGAAAAVAGLSPKSSFGQRKTLNIMSAPDPGATQDDMTPEAEALIKSAHTEAGEAVNKAMESIIKSEDKSVNVRSELNKAGFQLKSGSALAHARTVSISSGTAKKRKAARTRGWHWHVRVSGSVHSHASW